MKKSLSILAGVVVAGGVLHTVGAWYTGQQLERVLHTSVQSANRELQTATAGIDAHVSIELVSLERHLYSSTAHYQVNIQSQQLGEASSNLTLLFADHLEHGPLPLSRLKQLQLMPVMAASNIELENNPDTEKWFVAAKGASPVKSHINLGYDGAMSGTLKLLPLDAVLNKDSLLKFSGLNLALKTSAQAQHINLSGYMDSLKLNTTTADSGPVQLELNGLTLASDLKQSDYGVYLGQSTLGLSHTQLTLGDKPVVWSFKSIEQKEIRDASDNNLSAHLSYAVGEIAYNGQPVGSAEMLLSVKNLNIPAAQSLMQLYQTRLQPLQQARAAGVSIPALELSAAEQAQLQTATARLLSAKPQFTLEKLLLKTPNGEGHLSAALNLTQPQSAVLVPIEQAKQTIALLEAKLSVSKALIGDLAGLQAQIAGQTDPQLIAQQAALISDRVSAIAQAAQLARVNENDIVSSLHYADGQVDFNGQKMTPEAFAVTILSRIASVKSH